MKTNYIFAALAILTLAACGKEAPPPSAPPKPKTEAAAPAPPMPAAAPVAPPASSGQDAKPAETKK